MCEKIVSIPALLLLYTAALFPQALIDIPITITAPQTQTINLFLGVDPDATYGLDTLLGERNFYNPFPPTGEFEAYLDITSVWPGDPIWSLRDYRPLLDPPVFYHDSRLIWGMYAVPRAITIHYDIPPGVRLKFTDELGGVVIATPYLTGTGSLQVPDSLWALKIRSSYSYYSMLFPVTVKVPLYFYEDMIYPPLQLNFGLDSTATSGIDQLLGEFNITVMGEGFDVRFILSPSCCDTTTWTDIRYAPVFPFTGAVQHRLKWQFSQYPGSDTLYMAYNLPGYVTLQLKDIFGGILYSSPPINGSGLLKLSLPVNELFCTVTYNGAIPVELTSFTASAEGERVMLSWTTASETNNKGFELQRKTAGTWETAAFIPGAGTSASGASYTYTDDISGKQIRGNVYYRLVQTDHSGAQAYYDAISVSINSLPSGFALEQNYPNPFNPVTRIKYSIAEEGPANLSVYDLMGQKVSELRNENLHPGNYEETFDASSLASGVYLYKLSAGGKVLIKKMMVVR